MLESHLIIDLEISNDPRSLCSQYFMGRPALANHNIGIGIASWDHTILSQRRMDLYHPHLCMNHFSSRYSRNCTTHLLFFISRTFCNSSRVGDSQCLSIKEIIASNTLCCLSVSIIIKVKYQKIQSLPNLQSWKWFIHKVYICVYKMQDYF